MKNKISKIKGFSLAELIVVVAIISIMSVSGVVGFRYMGDALRVKEVKGLITDTIKKAELEIIREDYTKNTIHFLEDYLIIVSETEDKELDLNLNMDMDCVEQDDDGNLIKTDGDDNRLAIDTVLATDTYVCEDFNISDEIEWRYQLTRSAGSNKEVSEIIRFIHFNINRETPSGIAIDPTSDVEETMIIEAPYAKKTLSKTPITLEIIGERSTTDLIIQ